MRKLPITFNELGVRCPVDYCDSEPNRKCCDREGYTLAHGHAQRIGFARRLTKVTRMYELPENMNFDQYAEFVTRLGSKYSMGSFEAKAGTMALGIGGEVGEIAAITERVISDNALTEDNRLHLIDELGDIMWYVVFGCKNVLDITLPSFALQEFELKSVLYPVTSLKHHHMRLACRCGAACDITKKFLYHGITLDSVRDKLDTSLRRIAGTVALIAADVCGVTLQQIINRNVAKLSERYKSLEFSTEAFLAKENAKEE